MTRPKLRQPQCTNDQGRGSKPSDFTKVELWVKWNKIRNKHRRFDNYKNWRGDFWHLMPRNFFSLGQVFLPSAHSALLNCLQQCELMRQTVINDCPSVHLSGSPSVIDELAAKMQNSGSCSTASQRATTLSEQQTTKLSSQQEQKLGCRVLVFFQHSKNFYAHLVGNRIQVWVVQSVGSSRVLAAH